jgi:hypothetical protein
MFTLSPIQYAFVAGGMVDIVGGLPLMLHSSWTARQLDFPVAAELRFWPRYAAIFLFVLPFFYFVTAINPERYLPNVGVSVWGRIVGCAFYLWYYVKFPDHRHRKLLLGMALMNAGFALYYGWYLSQVPWSAYNEAFTLAH